jgi:hypothetical protein
MDVPDGDDTADTVFSDAFADVQRFSGNFDTPLGMSESDLIRFIRCYFSLHESGIVIPRAMHFLPNGEHGPPTGCHHEDVPLSRPGLLLDTDDTVTQSPCPAALLVFSRSKSRSSNLPEPLKGRA